MSISLREIQLVSANPAPFQEEFQWRIRLDVHEEIPADIEFKVIWVCSAAESNTDQVLEDCEVGPLALGTNELLLPHDAPDWRAIPPEHLLSVGFLIISVRYQDREFLRIAHFVNVALSNKGANCPSSIEIEGLRRNVLTGRPQINSRAIDWDTPMGDSMSGMQLDAPPPGSYGECPEGSRSNFSPGRSRGGELSNVSCFSDFGASAEGSQACKELSGGPVALPCPGRPKPAQVTAPAVHAP
eukprot:TRINITY_DN559_c0_g2_i2.p1 TRINITY_DN559_c0_g2~~TRINITY_DN559_c0_g2_i2.p1  ORF type:complete len:242 (+),score=80.24 TRINITY_DN559_c0_g2_i2:66-791(+)